MTLRAPYRCGDSLGAEQFSQLRRAMVLDHCKWDPQVGDTSVLADFPLILTRRNWQKLADWAEALTAEAMLAERELAARTDLHASLGLPRRLRTLLSGARPRELDEHTPRAYRYDFHFTRDGWRISECNADVPGGYAEGSAFPALMAEHYPSLAPAGDPALAWVLAIERAAQSRDIALLSAPGFLEDAQVIHYLARRLSSLGLRAHCLQPSQLGWCGGVARWGETRLGAVVRFYQAEWLSSLPIAARCLGFTLTPILNAATCIVIESKRFPVVWPALSTPLPTWRQLLPETRDPREVPWQTDDAWLLKTPLCNTGDTVSIRSLLSRTRWLKTAFLARCFPGEWVAQERFDPLPLPTPRGPLYPCIGIYTIAGRACGAYARLSPGPVVDYAAIDVPLLLEDDHADLS